MSPEEIGNIAMRTFVNTKIRNTRVRMQLDTGNDIIIINTKAWKHDGKAELIKLEKVAHGVTEKKIIFFCY